MHRWWSTQRYPFVFLIGVFVGAVVFIYLYGIDTIDPTNQNWLLQWTSDRNQHYIGWEFYRQSEWMFPYGLYQGLTGQTTSIVFTDSIPLFAVFFKLLSPILPDTFQYFGLWGIMCFMLQGGFGCLLIRRFVPSANVLVYVFTAVIFSTQIVLISRMFGHTALGANWIILAAMVIWLYSSCIKQYVRSILWITLSIIAANVHMYYIPMVFALMCGYILWDLLQNKVIWRNLLTMLCSIACEALVLIMLGIFTTSSDRAPGLGLYSANLNTFINPINNYSSFLQTLPTFAFDQYEGMAYIGLGIIIALIISVTLMCYNGPSACYKNIKGYITQKKEWVISILAVIVVTMFFAVSPTATLGKHIIYSIDYPEPIYDLLSIFRCSGRFAWITMYIIITLALVLLMKQMHNKMTSTAMIALVMLIQLADFDPEISRVRQEFALIYRTEILVDAKWNELGEKYEHIVFTPLPTDYQANTREYYTFGQYAYENGMDLSSFIIARANYDVMRRSADKAMDDIHNGTADPSTLYIFFNTEESDIPELNGFKCETVDGFVIGYVE